ncbi:Gas vesicle protein [Frankia torreyi]|uniref:Gas vesicle protein n=1 Tax=Frankia torreyi TaxID=1856 RepID=A0A0D8BGY6_9ACTN|nr:MULTISPECIES: gas vesicle protein [Frankia]KJE23406.1 Gas vesicle protein [Frankia torreyi]
MTVDRSLATGPSRARAWSGPRSDSLADVLERVLDKGIVIVGDVVVSVLDVELLTLKLRLFIASADTAREMGLDWWTADPFFNSKARSLREENEELRSRLAALEAAGRMPATEVGRGLPDRAAVEAPARMVDERRWAASAPVAAASRRPYLPWADSVASGGAVSAGAPDATRGESRHARGERR